MMRMQQQFPVFDLHIPVSWNFRIHQGFNSKTEPEFANIVLLIKIIVTLDKS